MRGILSSLAASCAVVAVSAALSASPVDKTPSVTGTVARVVASQRLVEVTLANGTVQRFQWNADTKISGTLTPGAAVTVRYAPGADGQNLALQITVSRS
jgi:YD repeat-containing protein